MNRWIPTAYGSTRDWRVRHPARSNYGTTTGWAALLALLAQFDADRSPVLNAPVLRALACFKFDVAELPDCSMSVFLDGAYENAVGF